MDTSPLLFRSRRLFNPAFDRIGKSSAPFIASSSVRPPEGKFSCGYLKIFHGLRMVSKLLLCVFVGIRRKFCFDGVSCSSKRGVGVILEFRAGSIYFSRSRERCQFWEVKRKKYLCGSWKPICSEFRTNFYSKIGDRSRFLKIYC